MCFVCACWMGFRAICYAFMISHISLGILLNVIPNSANRDVIQITSATPTTNSLYSNSIKDHEITFCLKELKKITLSICIIQYPFIDLLSSVKYAQLVLVYPIKSRWRDLYNIKSYSLDPLRYSSICLAALQWESVSNWGFGTTYLLRYQF